MSDAVKRFYTYHRDCIVDKRYNSPYWMRRYTHRQIHAQFFPYLKPGHRVLDAGCGDGVLTCSVAQQGVEVIGVDISAISNEVVRERFVRRLVRRTVRVGPIRKPLVFVYNQMFKLLDG